jgi:hypothetical protein
LVYKKKKLADQQDYQIFNLLDDLDSIKKYLISKNYNKIIQPKYEFGLFYLDELQVYYLKGIPLLLIIFKII